jgi:signal-transduction protein with cAMP-binding, CBS, and nucleotidyltransferase domain
MKVRELMTPNAICCLPTDTAESVAKRMLQRNVGSLPVVTDQDSRELLGIITDRDLCCSNVALGLDPKITLIEKFVRPNPNHVSRGVQLGDMLARDAATSDPAHSGSRRGPPVHRYHLSGRPRA